MITQESSSDQLAADLQGNPIGVLISGHYFGREPERSFVNRQTGEKGVMGPRLVLAVGTRLYAVKYRSETEVDAAVGSTEKGDQLTVRVLPQGPWSDVDGRRAPVSFRGVVPDGLDE